MKSFITKLLVISPCFVLLACVQVPPQYVQKQVPLVNIPARQNEANKLTLGTVQMYVKNGASGEQIISNLGSPNIITTDDGGGETWVYDKVSRESESSSNGSDSVSVSSSRTLTVVIKFDKAKKVKSSAFHSSSF